MSISTTCPSCKALFRLDEAMVGKKVRCQRCQHVFAVAASDAATNPDAVAADEAPKASDAPPPSSGDKVTSEPPRPRKPPRSDDSDDTPPRPRRRDQPAKSNTGLIVLLVLLVGGGGFGCVICAGGFFAFYAMTAVEQQQVAVAKKAIPFKNVDVIKDGFVGQKNVKADFDFLLNNVRRKTVDREVPVMGGKGFQGVPAQGFAAGGLPVQFDVTGRFRADQMLAAADRNKFGRILKQFAVPCKAGKTYHLDMLSDMYDCYLVLINDGGTIIAQDDDGGHGLNSHINFAATRDATFYIQASSLGGGGTGPFTLVIQER